MDCIQTCGQDGTWGTCVCTEAGPGDTGADLVVPDTGAPDTISLPDMPFDMGVRDTGVDRLPTDSGPCLGYCPGVCSVNADCDPVCRGLGSRPGCYDPMPEVIYCCGYDSRCGWTTGRCPRSF